MKKVTGRQSANNTAPDKLKKEMKNLYTHNNMKKVSIISLFLISGVFSCSKDNDSGRLVVRLTDSPGDYEAINVDIRDIQVNNHENDDSGWKSLSNVNKGVYNLLELTNGTETVLTNSEYPTGKINQIRLILGDSNSVVIGGTSYLLDTPSAQQSGLKLQLHATLTSGITYAILLDFDAAKSVIKTGNEEYILKPVIKVVSEAQDGAIAGQVIPAELNVAAYAISGTDTVSTSYAPAGTSEFFLGGLPPGSYTVIFDPGDSSGYGVITLENIVVALNSIKDAGVTELAVE